MTSQHGTADVGERAGGPARPDLDWVSWLRVLAICGVVVIHTTGATAVLPDARQTPEGVLALVLNRGFNFTVPVFVMLSGALLLDPARYRGDADFLRRRAARLVPAVVVWHLAYWALRVWYLDQDVPWRVALVNTLNGRMFTALYFFWIVLGLALVTPLLVPWVARAGRRAVLVAGVALAAMPALTVATVRLRGAPLAWVETPWTWWLPYLGIYLLGWGLRGVRLGRTGAAAAAVVAVVVPCAIGLTFRDPDAPTWLLGLIGGYYSFGVQAYACAVFVLVQAAVRPGGVLAVLARGRAARVGRALGDATLGVFALHLAVLTVSYDVPGLAGDPAAQSVRELLGRTGAVLVVTVAVVMVMRRVPVLRRLT